MKEEIFTFEIDLALSRGIWPDSVEVRKSLIEYIINHTCTLTPEELIAARKRLEKSAKVS